MLKRLMCGAAVVSSLALGACAGATNPFDFASVSEKSAPKSDVETGSLKQPQTELQKATEYWGKQFEANPKDAQAAINYVRNLRALDAKPQALAVIQQAYGVNPNHKGIASEYGRLALDQDQLSVAEKLLALADDPTAPDWKVISARGTLLAKQNKYRDAIQYFERAQALAPDEPSVLNNLALAYAMDGHAEKAEPMLRRAAESKGADPKVSHNLALVLGLQGKTEDAKSVMLKTGTTEESTEDVAMVKQMVGASDRRPVVQTIATGSTTGMASAKSKPGKTAARSKSKTVAEAPAEDPSVAVQRLADGFTATPADAPVQLQPKR